MRRVKLVVGLLAPAALVLVVACATGWYRLLMFPGLPFAFIAFMMISEHWWEDRRGK